MNGLHRKQMRRFEISHQPRFVTFSCWQRMALLSTDPIKSSFVEHLMRARERSHFSLHGWVIMPEHVHLILTPPLPNMTLAQILAKLKGDFARDVISRWRELHAPILERIQTPDGRSHFWQRGGGYDRNLRDDEELLEKLDYMHNNPVKRGLVRIATDYIWSSARWYAGAREGEPIIDEI